MVNKKFKNYCGLTHILGFVVILSGPEVILSFRFPLGSVSFGVKRIK